MPLAPEHRYTLKALAVLGFAAAAGALGLLYGGLYDVTATHQHTRPVYWALDTGMRRAVIRGAKDVVVPPLADETLATRGFAHYRDSCAKCHGAPGVAPEPFARGLMPMPNNLAQTALDWTPAELYWVTKHGLKMTAMPAWEFRYPDAELWAIVAFLQRLPKLTAADYAALEQRTPAVAPPAWPGGDARGTAARGAIALQQYACTSCHTIPGIVSADARVGPPLAGVATRKYLAGRLPNTPENLARWLREPKQVSATTLMPHLDVADPHARDIAAYLATLR
jgi:mono/diheme cytochrome c family protein/cytochrome c551/c552